MFIKFAGAGWLFPFYFGAAHYLGKRLDLTHAKAGGVSAGSVVATMLLLRIDFEKVLREILTEYDSMKYNPFLIKSCLQDVLSRIVPHDTTFLNNRLVVGVSYFDILKRVWKSDTLQEFPTRRTCIDALRASCHIPLVSGVFPYYVNGVGYYDGELADFSLDDGHKIEVELAMKPGTINPGIHLPEIWKYYPVDPFVLSQLFRLGFLRSKEFFKEARMEDKVEIERIKNVLNFCIRIGHVNIFKRLFMTFAQFCPRFIFIILLLTFSKKIFKHMWSRYKLNVKKRSHST